MTALKFSPAALAALVVILAPAARADALFVTVDGDQKASPVIADSSKIGGRKAETDPKPGFPTASIDVDTGEGVTITRIEDGFGF